MPRTVLRTSLLLLVILALAPATARATFDIASGSLVWPSGHELVFGSTGNLVGLQNDIGLAYLAPDGAVLDRRISSWIPGDGEESVDGADIAPDGHAWVGANAGGNYTFAEIVPGTPLELDNGPCPNGTLTLDLTADAFIYDIAIVGNKLYAVGSLGDEVLLVRLDLATCTIDYAVGIDPSEVIDGPAEGYAFDVVDDELVIVGYVEDLAFIINVDLLGELDDTFGDDGTMLFDFDGMGSGGGTLFDVEVVGDTIFSVGAGGAPQPGELGQSSVIQSNELGDGDLVMGRGLNLAPGGGAQGLLSLAFLDGDGFAGGWGAGGAALPRAALVRFDLATLAGDASCGGDGDVVLELGGNSAFEALELNGSLFGVGFVDNSVAGESFDYLKAKLTTACTIDTNFAGGDDGNRIGFIGAPPIGVRQPAGPPGPPPSDQFPNFTEVPAADFYKFHETLINLRRGRIGPFTLNGPETAPAGRDDTYRMGLEAGIRIAGGSAAQRRRARRVKLAGKTFNVAEGAQRRVFLRLTEKGKKALRATKGRRVRIQLRLVVRNEAGAQRSFSTSERLRVQRPRKKRRG